jgi:hypothetical protein
MIDGDDVGIHSHDCISDPNSQVLYRGRRAPSCHALTRTVLSLAQACAISLIHQASFIMMMFWGLVPGDDSEACLYLELVIMGCEKKKTNVSQEKKNVALEVVQYTGMYCMAQQRLPEPEYHHHLR